MSSPSAPASSQGFNPRARAGRDVAQPAALPPLQVSIHAPARGATCRSRASPSYGGVSIHAPARGATLTVPDLTAPDMFQSTRPRGARLHAPRHDRFRTKFQSTRPRGARPTRPPACPRLPQFQSTRPRGARLVGAGGARGVVSVSIHAPARGATPAPIRAPERRAFQSTRPRGARHRSPASQQARRAFQSTRPRGARLYPIIWTTAEVEFQSTRPRGARQNLQSIIKDRDRFNPRARAGRDTAWR